MRSFIAIEIPEDIKQRIAEVQRVLTKANIDASWPRIESMHLTLKFLGEVPGAQIDAVRQGLTAAVRGVGGFQLDFQGTGAFPNPRNARVAWIGVSGDMEKLNRLQAAVEDEMVRLGMEREERPFKPHITLARIKYIRSKEIWLRTLEEVKDIRLPGFEVKAVSLMKSELKRTGAEYTELARIELS